MCNHPRYDHLHILIFSKFTRCELRITLSPAWSDEAVCSASQQVQRTAFIYRISFSAGLKCYSIYLWLAGCPGVLGSLSYPRLTVPSLSPKAVFLHHDLLVYCRHMATTAAVSPARESPLSHCAALGQGCLSQCVVYEQHIHFLIVHRVIILLLTWYL